MEAKPGSICTGSEGWKYEPLSDEDVLGITETGICGVRVAIIATNVTMYYL
jgi:hypothetical protein